MGIVDARGDAGEETTAAGRARFDPGTRLDFLTRLDEVPAGSWDATGHLTIGGTTASTAISPMPNMAPRQRATRHRGLRPARAACAIQARASSSVHLAMRTSPSEASARLAREPAQFERYAHFRLLLLPGEPGSSPSASRLSSSSSSSLSRSDLMRFITRFCTEPPQ